MLYINTGINGLKKDGAVALTAQKRKINRSLPKRY
jgi:hypothetical protein